MEKHSRQELIEAAVEAELTTGVREATEAKAKSHILIRLARIGLGLLVTLLGIIMLLAPGPGALVIAAGLVILSRDVVWADRALTYLRRNVPGVPDEGKIPRSTLITSGLIGFAGVLVGLWFAFGRG